LSVSEQKGVNTATFITCSRIIAGTKTFFLKKCSLWDLMLVMILSVVRMQMLVHQLAVPVHMLVNQVCGRQ
jgi:hypothetical protein